MDIISKENFVKYINKLKELSKIEDEINQAGRKLEFFSISYAEHESLILDILTDIFDDKLGDWISYYIYELNLFI